MLALTSPVTMILDDFNSIVGDVRLPLIWLSEPTVSEVLAVISPCTWLRDASMLTMGALVVPFRLLAEPRLKELLAVTSPVIETLELVVMLAPLIGPVMVEFDPILTLPVALSAAADASGGTAGRRY